MDRVIFHCDCNGFYASVAEQVNPQLKTVPMAVCGDPHSRKGIILAKNELAKKYNIQTAETIWQARQKCPQLVLAPTHRELYEKYNKQLNTIYEEYTDLLEIFGIDESFLDLTHSIHLFGDNPVALANQLRERVQKESGLTISVGVSYNKIFAKLGSDYKKPNAVTHITKENYKQLLWRLPVSRMYMVGESTQKVLDKLYIKTIGELAVVEEEIMEAQLGKAGVLIHNFANGIDNSPVVSYRNAEPIQSVGNGRTFRRNLITPEDIRRGVSVLSDNVAARLRRYNLKCLSLQITIKDAQLKSITRQRGLKTPTYLGRELFEIAMELIEENWRIGVPIRMLTVTAGKLVPVGEVSRQTSLFDEKDLEEKSKKQEDLELAIDKLRGKFGKGSVIYGSIVDNDLGID